MATVQALARPCLLINRGAWMPDPAVTVFEAGLFVVITIVCFNRDLFGSLYTHPQNSISFGISRENFYVTNSLFFGLILIEPLFEH